MPKIYDEIKKNIQKQVHALLEPAVQARMESHGVDVTDMNCDDDEGMFTPRVTNPLKELVQLCNTEYLEKLTKEALLKYLQQEEQLSLSITAYCYYENGGRSLNLLNNLYVKPLIFNFVGKTVLGHLFGNHEIRQILFKNQSPRDFKYNPIIDDISYVNKSGSDPAINILSDPKDPKATGKGPQFLIRNSSVEPSHPLVNIDRKLLDVSAEFNWFLYKILANQLDYCMSCDTNGGLPDEALQALVLEPGRKAVQQTERKLQRICDDLMDMLLLHSLFYTTAYANFSKFYDNFNDNFTKIHKTSEATQIASIKEIKVKFSQLIEHRLNPLRGIISFIKAETIGALCVPIVNTDLPHRQRIAHLLLYWVPRSHGCREEKADAMGGQEDFSGFSVLMDYMLTTHPDTLKFKLQQVTQLLISLCIRLAVGDYEAPELDAALNTLKGWFTEYFADDSEIKDEVEWQLSARNMRRLKEVQRQGHLTRHAQLASSKPAQQQVTRQLSTSIFTMPRSQSQVLKEGYAAVASETKRSMSGQRYSSLSSAFSYPEEEDPAEEGNRPPSYSPGYS